MEPQPERECAVVTGRGAGASPAGSTEAPPSATSGVSLQGHQQRAGGASLFPEAKAVDGSTRCSGSTTVARETRAPSCNEARVGLESVELGGASTEGARPGSSTHEETMITLESNLSDEVRAHVAKLDELFDLVAESPEGVDVSAKVEEYLATAGEETALAIATYLRDALRPALKAGRESRKSILANVKRNEQEEEWLKGVLGDLLDRLGQTKVKGASVGVTRTKGQERVVVGEHVDLNLLPADCVRVELEPDKDTIGTKLRRGEDVVGCRLERTPGVMIR